MFQCSKCGSTSLIVDVQLNYDEYESLVEDVGLPVVSDYFENILVCGTCTTCSHRDRILEMDL